MFQGADVDGLDQISTVSTAGADATDAVKAACEAIADALVFTGPAGAQFASYLKTMVIPWMNVVAQCLRAFSAVLKAASTVQRAVSAGETVDTSSHPTYQSPEQLPAGDTRNYPVMSEDSGSSSGGFAGDGSSSSGASTADGCGKDDSGATTVATADSCDKDDTVKTETVATGSEKDTVRRGPLGDGTAVADGTVRPPVLAEVSAGSCPSTRSR